MINPTIKSKRKIKNNVKQQDTVFFQFLSFINFIIFAANFS